ncbi:MAG: ATP-binding cassette domain-containing protein [Treponema sp.]|jgi:ABC-type bacteriocin/lantibiotic exporter with double-glycine peptidase domain|nr:ATP-binding cassette domain-containing protein [Treponema sp.]
MPYPHIVSLLKTNRAVICYSFLLSLFLLFPMLMSPIFTRIFTDSILIDNTIEWLLPLLILMGGIAVFSALVTWIQKNCLLRLSNRIELSGIASYMWRLFDGPSELFYHKDSFVLLAGTEASSLIARTLIADILSLFPATISVLFYCLIMFRLDSSLSFIVLALVIVNNLGKRIRSLLVNVFTRPAPEDFSARDLVLRDERISSRGLESIETFKATASETHFFQEMMSSKIRIINARSRDDEAEASDPFNNIPEICFLNLLILISALRIMNREMTIGSYLEFQAYAAAFFYPMNQVFSAPGIFSKLEERLRNLHREMETGSVSPVPIPAAPSSIKKLQGYVEFRDVSFSFPGGRPLLENFNLSLKPGQRAAIVGKSGSGKTTVVKLLQGFYAPTAGEVTINGMAPALIDRDAFTASIGCANQKLSFFTASVRDNITLWNKEISDGAVYRAAKDTGLHSFIATLEGGYDHILEENGRILSGGQQQQMEIARGLLYHPSILILDEVTGAIDPATVSKLEGNFKERGCTVLQTTQILSPIVEYDEIILLDRGKIAARGSHKDLLKQSPWYAALFRKGEITG